MGIVGTLVGFAIVGTAIRRGFKSSKLPVDDEIDIRRYTTCDFDNGVTESTFDDIISEIVPKLPRYVSHTRNGAIVRVVFKSRSGLSQWSARIGFAEYGKLTSHYWIESNNDDSILPEALGDRVAERLEPLLEQARDDDQADDVSETSKEDTSGKGDWKIVVGCFAVLVAICAALHSYPYIDRAIHSGQSKMPLSSQSLIGKNYEDVEKSLTDSGFTSVHTIAKGDLPWFLPIHLDANKIAEVQVDGIDSFSEGDWLDSDINIIIYYHSRQN